MKFVNLLIYLTLNIMNIFGQEFDVITDYGPLQRTYTGKTCQDCLDAGRNHCLLSDYEGICCDKGDERCTQTAMTYGLGTYCAEAVAYDKLTSFFTCPTTKRCPQGNVDLNIDTFDTVNGFSDSWTWYQYIFGSVCKFRVHSSTE